MMSNKLYLVLVILAAVFVIGSLSDDEKPRKQDSLLDGKKKSNAFERGEQRSKSKQRKYEDYDDDESPAHRQDIEEYGGSISGYADNRYTGSSGSEGNYRTRSRWPAPSKSSSPSSSQYGDFADTDDWLRFEFSNPLPTNSPPMPFDNQPALNNGPTCHSLVDPQYPIFSDICGAVPQARYALPNTFGHHERWQIAQLLSNVVSSSTEAGCTRSLRLLLCPVLFPPCQSRLESPPILPCQSYCRAVKSRCSLPALDVLPCDILPYSSDICPTNQAYGSFVPPTTYPSLNQQSPLAGGLSTPNLPLSRSLALQSFLASQGLQSQLTPSGFPLLPQQSVQPLGQQTSSPFAQQFAQQTPSHLVHQFAQQTPQQLNQQTPQQLAQQTSQQSNQQQTAQQLAQQAAFLNLLNSGNQYSTDSLTSMFADLSSQTNAFDPRQNAQHASLARPTTEARSQAEIRFPSMTRPASIASPRVPSGASSVVRA